MNDAFFTDILSCLCASRDLSDEQVQGMMSCILAGEWSPVKIASAIIGLKIKGETPREIANAVRVMRKMATAVELTEEEKAQTVDTCGTGGDSAKTFNISTAVSFVVAATGVRVAKHGNRAVSGSSGSSDVLEALGATVDLTPEKVLDLIRRIGIGFMFAPVHHAAMKYAAPVRKELGVRTLFNLLGPLSNPAGVQRQVIGVYSSELLLPYAEVLMNLSTTHAWVVHGKGMDEISISDETDIAEVKNQMILRHVIAPEDVGLTRRPISDIQVTSVTESKERILSALNGETGASRDVVLLNAAAVLVVANKVPDFSAGVKLAALVIDSGAARQKLNDFIAATNA